MKLNQDQNNAAANSPAVAQEQTLEAKLLAMLEGTPKPERLLRDKVRAKTAEQVSELKKALKDLSRSGKALQHRGAWRLTEGLKSVEGTVCARPTGVFFLSYKDGAGVEQTAMIPPKTARALIPGDWVVASLIEPREAGYPVEACPTKILSRGTPFVWARATADAEQGGALRWSAERRVESQWFDTREPMKEGEIALLEVLEHNFLGQKPRAKIIERLGNQIDSGIETRLSERMNEIEKGFSDASIAQAESAQLPSLADEKNRLDLRHIPFCTIDGENSRDFDDAIAAQPKASGGWKLWVAIADVGHYVPVGSPLDMDARRKMTSVYLPHGVEPMLPEKLSNGLCSLNPGQDRLALCVEIDVSAAGEIEKETFVKAMMRSHARLTYTQVSAFIDGVSGLPDTASEDVARSLDAAHNAQQAMINGPLGVGRIDMGQNERETRLGDDGKIASIEPRERDSASRLVEEMMLAANRAAAAAVAASGAPGIFRNHFAPTEDALDELRLALKKHDVELVIEGDAITSADFARLVEKHKDHPHYAMIRSEVLHRFSSAVYASENAGHFSLGMAAYAQFTSPIRRYPDLLTHRSIAQIILGETPTATREEMDENAAQATILSRKSRDAETEARKLLSIEYASRHVGVVTTARLENMMERGIFAHLEGLNLEAFIPAKAVSGARFDRERELWFKDDGSELLPGDTMPAKIQSVAVNSRRIELVAGPAALLELDAAAASAPEARAPRGPGR